MGASAATGLPPRDSGLVPDLPCPSSACPRQIGSGLLAASLQPGDATPIRRRCSAEPPMTLNRRSHRAKEVAMTRRVRLWVAAVLIAAASGLMAAVAVTATMGVNHTPAHVYLAGVVFNALD